MYFNLSDTVDIRNKEYSRLIPNMFKRMLFYGTENYKYDSNWLTSLFKSIVKLDFGFHGMSLLHLMPIELLFDKHDSKLLHVYMNHYLNSSIPFNSFFTKYLNYFNQLQVQFTTIT